MFTALLVSNGVGCDVDGPELERQGPNLFATEVLVRATPEAEAQAIANDGSTVAFTGSAIRVELDRYLDPRSVIRQAYCLQSDLADIESFDQCSSGLTTSPAYDPVTRSITIYLSEHLAPETLYKLTLLSPPEQGAGIGLRAIDGAPLDATRAVTFRTAPDTDPPAALEAPIPTTLTCERVAKMLAICESCHRVEGDEDPPMGFTVDIAGLGSAIGRSAHQTSLGGDADESQERPGRFGAAMPLIDASRSAGNSYLLYKLLAHAPGREEGLAEGETERLRSSVVVGLPMPPPSEDIDEPRAALTTSQLREISHWIAAGAPCSSD